MTDTFDDLEAQLIPNNIADEYGKKWASVFGLLKEIMADFLMQAIKARYPEFAHHDDVFEALAFERNVARAPTETIDAFRTRLRRTWLDKEFYGTAKGLKDAIETLGMACTVNELSITDPGTYDVADDWARYELDIWEPGITNGEVIGGFNIGDGTIIGIAGDVENWHRIIALVRQVEPKYAYLQAINFHSPSFTVNDPIIG